jgi:hypothetical protein
LRATAKSAKVADISFRLLAALGTVVAGAELPLSVGADCMDVAFVPGIAPGAGVPPRAALVVVVVGGAETTPPQIVGTSTDI